MARKKLTGEEIDNALNELKGWRITDGKLYRRFVFSNFAESLDFVNRVSAIAEERDHHPDVRFGWGYAEFSVTTHDTGGLTHNDFDLAGAIEKLST